MEKIKKRSVIIILCLAIIISGAFLIGAVGAGNKENAADSEVVDNRVLVETQNPTRGNIVVTGEYIGTVEPNRQVTVYPKATGEILSINYNVGDYVEAGAVLCELDSKTLNSSISQMQAAVASAQAKANYNLAMAEFDLEVQEYNIDKGYNVTGNLNLEAAVKAAENRLDAANLGYNVARRNLREFTGDKDDYINAFGEEIYDSTVTPLRDAVRKAQLDVESAEIGLEQARQSLETANKMSDEQKESAVARVRMAELNTNLSDQYIAIQKLQDDLKNYSVTTSISGIIEKRNVDPFDMASPQTPLFVISDKNAMTVSFGISETGLLSMRIGDGLKIEKSGVICAGKITEIASALDAKSGLFTVKAVVENPPAILYSGSAVKVFADVQKAENDILIPIDALYYENGKPFVYLVKDGAAVKTFVETGISNEQNIQILSGITLDDEIISTWNSKLSDGAKIKFSADEAIVEE